MVVGQPALPIRHYALCGGMHALPAAAAGNAGCTWCRGSNRPPARCMQRKHKHTPPARGSSGAACSAAVSTNCWDGPVHATSWRAGLPLQLTRACAAACALLAGTSSCCRLITGSPAIGGPVHGCMAAACRMAAIAAVAIAAASRSVRCLGTAPPGPRRPALYRRPPAFAPK